jgi:hypothetical protein
MISCQTFRATLQPGTTDAALLEHLRHCDACLDHALRVDPDLFFRAAGGEELEPAGGVDAFVGEVMAQVRSRQTESALVAHRPAHVWQRFAVAATIAAAITGGTLAWRADHGSAPAPSRVIAAAAPAPHRAPAVTKSLVETYSSQNATIVEVPSEGTSDVKVVMIFDDKLPADL